MRFGRGLLIMALACAVAAAEPAAEGPEPVGFLAAEVYTPAAVTVAQGGFVTIRLVNVGASPVRLGVGPFDIQPSFVALFLPKARGQVDGADVWGPEIGEALNVPIEGVDVTGFSYRPTAWWPDGREGFILLKDEGYARRIVFRPEALPKQALARGRQIILDASPVVSVALPRIDRDAVQAGKPIRFDEIRRVYAPGARTIDVAMDLPRGETLRAAQPAGGEAPAPWLDLEAPRALILGEDFEFTYMVGNRGPEPIWIWQDSLALHRFAWEITDRMDAVISQGDGRAMQAMADLAPVRPPQVLMPGEFLSVKMVILAGETTMAKAGTILILQSKLTVRVAADGRGRPPAEGVEVPLVAETSVRVQRRR